MIHSIRVSVCAGVMAVMCVVVYPRPAFSADKPKEQQISHTIGKEFEAAQKAMKANQWADVIKNLEAAEAKGGLTAFDKKSIYDYKGFAYIKLSKYKEAEAAYEQAMASGAYSAEDSAKTTKMLFQLAAQNQQFQKAIEYGKTATEQPGVTPNDFLIMAQLYYQQKDCKNSNVWGEKAVNAYKKSGEAPKEVLFQIKLQCASDAQDNAGMLSALYDLVRLTNKTTYWNNLIRIERQDERDDKNLLMIYRVMFDTNSMTVDSDFIEMAQLLGDAGLPAEAAAVLDKANSTGIMKDEHKERTTRLLNSLKARADADRKSIASQDAEAQKAATGDLSVTVGEAHFGLGEFAPSVASISAGLQKGQVKHLTEAYVYLGRSQVALKNVADAKKAFSQLKTVTGISPRVLKLWDLYSDKLG
jgi:tetratricopeptide (TPR) repeat protein